MLKIITCVALIIFSFLGCATGRKNVDLENQSLKNQITVLQAQLQDKDQQITSLQEALDNDAKEKAALTTQVGSLSGKYRPVTIKASVRQIQIALRNAGYDIGKLDGVMGSKTRQAVKSFQKSNDLKVSGKVDKATWLKLRVYLQKKVK